MIEVEFKGKTVQLTEKRLQKTAQGSCDPAGHLFQTAAEQNEKLPQDPLILSGYRAAPEWLSQGRVPCGGAEGRSGWPARYQQGDRRDVGRGSGRPRSALWKAGRKECGDRSGGDFRQ